MGGGESGGRAAARALVDGWLRSWRRRVHGRQLLRGVPRCRAALPSAPLVVRGAELAARRATGMGMGRATLPGARCASVCRWRETRAHRRYGRCRHGAGRRWASGRGGLDGDERRGEERRGWRQRVPREKGPCGWRSGLFTTLRLALGRTLKKLWEEEGTMAKWEASSWAKKRKAHALKATATDFDRFQARRLRLIRQSSSPAHARTRIHSTGRTLRRRRRPCRAAPSPRRSEQHRSHVCLVPTVPDGR